MRLLRGLAVVICAVLAGALPAIAEPVPFLLIRDKVVVPVTVNGRETFAFVDTAAGKSAIAPELAKELALPEGRPAKVVGLNGKPVPAAITPGVEMTLAGVPTRIELLVTDMSLGGHLKGNVEALVGHDILSQYVVAIDFDALTIDLTPATTFTAFPETEPVRLKKLGQNWTLPVQIDGVGSRDAVFDLGAEGAMVLAPGPMDRLRLTFGRKTSAASLASVSGDAKVTMMSLRSIKVGGAEFGNVPVSLLSGRRSYFTALAGTALLSRFNLLIDLSRERVWMTPNRHASAPFRRGVTGLILGADMVLDMVAPGSPARAAGFKTGDRIAAMYDAAGAPILDTYTIDAGESVRVVLADGREKTIMAAEYY